MNPYVTGTVIKGLREGKGLTQAQLAARLQVSDKAVSKWETAKGYPDITLIEPLAQALDISVMELLSGDCVTNANRAGNLLRAKWYVCPICGNIIHSTGAAVLSCCGLTLPPLEPEAPDEDHAITLEPVVIEDDVWIGANCFIGPGVRIGHGSVVGAGSVVLKSIPPMSVAAGVPCRTIRPITDDDRVERPL